jgi:hypothetical protein
MVDASLDDIIGELASSGNGLRRRDQPIDERDHDGGPRPGRLAEFADEGEPVSVPTQTFEPFLREGFTAVECGGSKLGGDWHVVR